VRLFVSENPSSFRPNILLILSRTTYSTPRIIHSSTEVRNKGTDSIASRAFAVGFPRLAENSSAPGAFPASAIAAFTNFSLPLHHRLHLFFGSLPVLLSPPFVSSYVSLDVGVTTAMIMVASWDALKAFPFSEPNSTFFHDSIDSVSTLSRREGFPSSISSSSG
jgi:hypothetical protein